MTHESLTHKTPFICWSDAQHRRDAPQTCSVISGPIRILPLVPNSFSLSYLLLLKMKFSWWMKVVTSDRLGSKNVFGVSASVDSPEWKCLLGHFLKCFMQRHSLGWVIWCYISRNGMNVSTHQSVIPFIPHFFKDLVLTSYQLFYSDLNFFFIFTMYYTNTALILAVSYIMCFCTDAKFLIKFILRFASIKYKYQYIHVFKSRDNVEKKKIHFEKYNCCFY